MCAGNLLERDREEDCEGEKKAAPTSFDQGIRSTVIRGPIWLKFGEHVHDTRLFNLDGGYLIWCFPPYQI